MVEWQTAGRVTGSACGSPLKTVVSTSPVNGSAPFYGVAAGGLEQRGAFDQSLHFDLEVDFAKLTGWSALEGLTGVAGVRYRDGLNVNNFVGASSTFNPSTYQSGKQWRLLPFFLTYTTPALFGVKDFLTLSGGWANPYDIFAQQRESKFLRNNAIISSKGISANDVGWSSGYVVWGGYMKIKRAKWYLRAGRNFSRHSQRQQHG